MRPRPFFIPFSILESRCHLNELECKRMHGTNKDGARRNKGRGIGGKEGREIEIERERERNGVASRYSLVGRSPVTPAA